MPYINEPGFEVPENSIVYYPSKEVDCDNKEHSHPQKDYKISDVIEPLIGKPNREWFTYPFSFCLPLSIANQYGFVVKAAHDISLYWTGGQANVHVESEGFHSIDSIQGYFNNFGSGVMSIENHFILRTPPQVNIMVMPAINSFIPDLYPLFGVVEADNLRRSFTFNLKVTVPNKKIYIKKGDWLASFIPIPRYFVENFELKDASKIYKKEVLENERKDIKKLTMERNTRVEHGGDVGKVNDSGRRYFKGIFADDTPFPDHQKRIK